MRMIQRALFLATVVAIAAPTQAAIVTYTDRAAWEAATTIVNSVEFEGIAPFDNHVWQGTSTTIEGVQFNGSDGMYVIDGAFGGGYLSTGTGATLFGYSLGITIDPLVGSMTSFGVDLRGYDELSTTFDITLSTGELFTRTINNPTNGGAGGGFFGVTTDNPFLTVRIDPRGNFIAIDNFAYGAAVADVPAPASLILWGMGGGLAFFGQKLRRGRKTEMAA